ncbi:MAG: DnaD domain protein [Erysipelotrichaceae bacterium]|nr:DnaD domain protein [Erysipelotrichaceae bacterium]
MKWYKQNYVNRRDWILDNLEYLGLSEKETVIVLLIDFLNENNINITIHYLSKKTNIDEASINKILSVLVAKKYLQIEAKSKKAHFILDGLFEIEVASIKGNLDTSLFDLFETEFKRPLTPKEMEKVSDWLRTIDSKLVLEALKQASMYKKVNISYIDKILRSWQEKNITIKMIEEGKYIDNR